MKYRWFLMGVMAGIFITLFMLMVILVSHEVGYQRSGGQEQKKVYMYPAIPY